MVLFEQVVAGPPSDRGTHTGHPSQPLNAMGATNAPRTSPLQFRSVICGGSKLISPGYFWILLITIGPPRHLIYLLKQQSKGIQRINALASSVVSDQTKKSH
jgi:hypothetical protein